MSADISDIDFGGGDFEDLDLDNIAPGVGSDYAKPEDLVGCLLLCRPYDSGMRDSTMKNAKPGDKYLWVECDVHVVQMPKDGKWHPRTGTNVAYYEGRSAPFVVEALQFSGANVAPWLKRQLDKAGWAFGRFVEGERKSRDQNAPWLFMPPTDEEKAIVYEYVKAQKAQAQAKAKTTNIFE